MGRWTDIGIEVYDALKADAALMALLSNGVDSVYPLMAPPEAHKKFITYGIEDLGYQSKDLTAGKFNIIINSYGTTYKEIIDMAEAVIAAFATAGIKKSYRGGRPQYDEENRLHTTQIFNLKK